MGHRRDTSAIMTLAAFQFSDDQAEAFDRVSTVLRHVGVNLDDGLTTPMSGSQSQVMALIGKAGSGKTLLLA